MAKKKNTPLPSFMNAGNSWYNDLKKWEKDREVRVEQSKAWDAAGDKAPYAGRITPTYNDEKFNEKEGTLANKSSKWRTSAVEKLSSKRYGKKYNDRLHSLMDEAGIPKSERYEFARWMDANEQKVDSDVIEGYQARPVTEKESFMADRGPQLNMALPDVKKRNVSQALERVKNENRNPFEKVVNKAKNVDGGDILDTLKGAATGALDGMNRFQARAVDALTFGQASKSLDKNEKEGVAGSGEDIRRKRGGVGGAADVAADLTGMFGFGMGAAGALRGAKLTGKGMRELAEASARKQLTGQAVRRGAADAAREGAIIGGGMAGLDEAAKHADDDSRTWQQSAKNVALGVGLGATIDPLIALAGPLAKAGMRRTANNAVDQTARSAADRLEELSRPMPRMADVEVAGRNISNSVRSPLENQGNASRNILEGLADPALNQRNLAQTLRNPSFSKVDGPESSQMNIWERFDRPVSTTNNRSVSQDVPAPGPQTRNMNTERSMDEIARLEQDPEFNRMSMERNQLLEQLEQDPNPIRSGRAKGRIMELNEQMQQRSRAIFDEQPPTPPPASAAVPEPEQVNPAMDTSINDRDLGPEEMAMRGFLLDSDPEFARLREENNVLWDEFEKAELADDFDRIEDLTERIRVTESAMDVRKQAVLSTNEPAPPVPPAGPEPSIRSTPQPPAGEPDDIMNMLRNTPVRPEALQSASTPAPAAPPPPAPENPLDILRQQVREEGAQLEGTLQGTPRFEPVDLENYDSPIHYRDPDAPAAKKKEDSLATEFYRKFVSATGEFRKIDDYFHNMQKQKIADALPENVDVDKLLTTTRDGAPTVDSSVRKGLRGLTRIQAKGVSFMENNYKGVAEKIKKYNIKQQNLDEYALARHAMDVFEKNGATVQQRHTLEQQFDEMVNGGSVDLDELNKLQDEIADLNPYRLHESVTPEWAESIIRQFEADPKINEVYNDFKAAQKKTLEYARDNGTISNETFEMLQKEHPNYVSLARHVDPSASRGNGPGSGNTGIGTRGDGSESLKHLPPFETAMRNAYIIATKAERNKALQPIVKMAGMDDLGEYFVKRSAPSAKTLTVHVNGKPQHYEVPDHMLWYVNEGYKTPAPDKLGKLMRIPANTMRKLTTHYNPAFHAVSAVRDTQQAVFQSRTGNPLEMAVDVSLGFVDSFAGELLEQVTKGRFKSVKKLYEQNGGGYTQLITTDQESMAKSAKAIQDGTFGKPTTGSKVKSIVMAPADMLEKFGNAIERGPKLGELRSAKRKGYDLDDAMFESVDVMDYSDVGTEVRKINPYVPYFGATMRGNARIMKSFTEGGAKGAAKQLGKGAMMFTVPSAIVYAMREMDYVTEDQRNELRNMQDWQKNLYWNVPMPDGETILSIHKPHVLGQLFSNPLERSLDQVNEETMKTDVQAGQQAMKDLLFSFIPPSEMAGLSTVLDIARNQDGFTKFEIESQYDKDAGVPVRDRESYEQSNVTRGIANVLNMGQEEGWASPAKVDFAVKDLTGTMGKQALTGLDDLIRQVDPRGKHGSNAGVRDSMDELLKPITQFKADSTRASGVPNALKRVAANEKKGNRDKSKMSEEEKAAEDARRPAQNYQKDIKELNKAIQAVKDNKKLKSDEKRRRIEELRKQQDDIGSDVINWWNRMN